MGITALISSLIGLVSGVVPRIFDTFNKAQDHKREMAVRESEARFREMDHRLAMERVAAEARIKLDESYLAAAAEEAKAAGERMLEQVKQWAQPTGFALIDQFNAILRPLSALIILLMFVVAVLSYMFGITAINADFAKAMAGLFTFSVEAVFGFLFAYRATIPRPGRT